MGMARLKIKDSLHYRRGGTSASCSGCNNFVRNFKRHGLGGDFIAEEPRCIIMGLEHSTRYRIHPDNICDIWDQSVSMLRLLGETKYLELYGESRLAQAKEAAAAREAFDKSRTY